VGLFDKRDTAAAVQAQSAQLGSWVGALQNGFPFLRRDELLGLAGMRALLAVDTGLYVSSYVTEGKHTQTQIDGFSYHSLLRCEAIPGGARLSCGAPKPGNTFVSNWELTFKVSDTGAVSVEVPHYRVRDDKLTCGVLMIRVRDAVKGTLSSGIHLHLGDGPPVLDGLVVDAPARRPGYPSDDKSPFARDYLDILSDRYRQPLELPHESRAAVVDAMSTSHFRTCPGEGNVLMAASLAGGRPFYAGSVVLREGASSDQVVIELPAEALSPLELQRSYRAALRFLFDIARRLEDGSPSLARALDVHVEQIDADTKRPDRHTSGWRPYWSENTPAPVVPVQAERWYPVGVRVTTSREVNYLAKAVEASDWVNITKRTFALGIRQSTRDENRTYSTRRCGLLTDSAGKQLPYLRYVWHRELRDHVMTTASSEVAWFWEVASRTLRGGEPANLNGGLLLVTGWTHADGIVGYGENLLTMLTAFVDVVQAADKEVRIQTLYMAT